MTGFDAQLIGQVRLLVGEAAEAPFLPLSQPLSLWGGIDAETGIIIDRNHPDVGISISGRAVKMPASRGSSSSSSVLLECLRRGTAPAVLMMQNEDMILTVGAAAAWEIYGRGPVVGQILALRTPANGTIITVRRDGSVTALHASAPGRCSRVFG